VNNEELCYLSAIDLASAIRDKSVSPVEVTQAVLDRIERLNPVLNAFCISMADEAMETAKAAEAAVMRGDELGPLHGVPIPVKDNLYIKGVRTTFGSKLLEHNITEFDAPIIERLKKAGAVIVGRTNSPEFGWKGVTDNLIFGETRNPWNVKLTPGGSSGGSSAAVAAGMGPIGIGTDGGGSLRIPASFCGIVGLKPSLGRVPTYPGVSVGSMRHIGGMTRTVADSALLLNVIAGPDERDSESLPASDTDYLAELDKGISGLRIAYSADLGYAQVDPEVAALCEAAALRLSEAGAIVEQVNLDWSDPYECWNVFFYGSSADRLGDELAKNSHLLDPGLRLAVERAVLVSIRDYTTALSIRNDFWQQVRQVYETYDLLLTPALAVPPFPLGQNNADPFPGQTERDLQWTQFTYPFNLTGQPACSVPCGWTKSNLPVGLQIVGGRFDDATVLRAARALEKIQPWSDRRPDVPETL